MRGSQPLPWRPSPLLIGRTARVSLRRMAVFLAVFAVAGTFAGGAISPVVRAADPVSNFPVHAEFRPNDPYYIDQWGMQKIGAPNAWDVTLGSPSVVVAVVDTGVWWTHQDIQANMWVNPSDGTSHGYDFIDGDTNPMDNDPSGVYHGTGVAGVIAAIIDNGQDVAGTAQVKVMALRALGLNGQGSSLNTSQAIRWAAQHGAKVINLSLGTNETFGGPTDIQFAIDYAWSRGALVVAAAGNAGTGTLDYPARLPNVVSVAAIDETGLKASFSNYGLGLDLAAPGDRILTLDGNNQVHYLRGTSFAAPFVTGAAALLLSVDPALTNVELWNILNSTAVQPSGGPAYNTNYGWGVVNTWNAINALRQPFISVNAFPASIPLRPRICRTSCSSCTSSSRRTCSIWPCSSWPLPRSWPSSRSGARRERGAPGSGPTHCTRRTTMSKGLGLRSRRRQPRRSNLARTARPLRSSSYGRRQRSRRLPRPPRPSRGPRNVARTAEPS